jgi:hypothetical protein
VDRDKKVMNFSCNEDKTCISCNIIHIVVVGPPLGSLHREDVGSVSDVSEIPTHECGGSRATKTWAALPTSTQRKDSLERSILKMNNCESPKSVTIRSLELIESTFTLQTFYTETDLQ